MSRLRWWGRPLRCAAALLFASCNVGDSASSKGAAFDGMYESPTHGIINAVAVVGNRAYVAESQFGVRILDVSDPGHMTLLGSLPLTGVDATGGARLALAGSHLYVASHGGCLDVVDVSNPAGPVHASSFKPLGCDGRGMYVSGTTLYLADAVNGLWVLDITAPASPVSVGVFDVGGFPADVRVNGNRAYVIASMGDLLVLDVTNRGAPVVLGNWPLSSNIVHGIALDSATAWVAGGVMTLSAYDVSRPESPTLLSTYRGGNDAYDAQAVALVEPGSLLVAITGSADAVWRMDVSDPSRPSVKSRFQIPGGCTAVAVAGHRLFAGDTFGKLWTAGF